MDQDNNSVSNQTNDPLDGSMPSAPNGYYPTAAAPKSTNKRKKIIMAVVAGAVVVAVTVYAFVFYIPNRPQNVWKAGFDRSGKMLDALVDEVSSQETVAAYQKVQLDGTVSVKSDTTNIEGTIKGTFDDKTTNSTATISADTQQDGTQLKLTADIRSRLADGNMYPDTYFRLTGIDSLGLTEFMPGLTEFDGQWVSLTGDYLEGLLAQSEPALKTDATDPLTQEDINEAAKVMATTTKEYVLTDDADKAVITRKQFVGRESSEGVSAYHYKASIHKAHAQAYCIATGKALQVTTAYKKLAGDAQDININEDCKESTSDIKDSETFDIWISAKQKVLQKVRFVDPEQDGTTIEIGHTYQGGDKVPQFMRIDSTSDKYKVEENLTYNKKTKDVHITVEGKGEKTDTTEPVNFTVSLLFTPYKGEVRFEEPEQSVPFESLFNSFGVDPVMLEGPVLPQQSL